MKLKKKYREVDLSFLQGKGCACGRISETWHLVGSLENGDVHVFKRWIFANQSWEYKCLTDWKLELNLLHGLWR